MLNHKFQKIVLAAELLEHSENAKKELLNELLELGTDDIYFMRRFRMLQQLADFESQIIKKIYQFNTDDDSDYLDISSILSKELLTVVSRNA